MDEIKPVETTEGAGAPEEVEKTIITASDDEIVGKVDFLAQELERVSKERDNYRTGLLQAKGKLPMDSEETPAEVPDVKEMVRQEVAEALKNTEREKEYQKTIRELKVALKNNSQVQTTTQGGSSDKPTLQPSSLSPDQIKALKARNPRFWTDEKIKKYGTGIARPQ